MKLREQIKGLHARLRDSMQILIAGRKHLKQENDIRRRDSI
jgi:hypothetical protein